MTSVSLVWREVAVTLASVTVFSTFGFLRAVVDAVDARCFLEGFSFFSSVTSSATLFLRGRFILLGGL